MPPSASKLTNLPSLICGFNFSLHPDMITARPVQFNHLNRTHLAFHNKSIIPIVKHGGGSVMFRGCFVTSEPG